MTRQQLPHWRNTETLMQHAVDATGENYIAHAYLGAARHRAGDAAGAVREWRRSVAIEPAYATVANNLAWLLATHPDAALRAPDEAVRLAERAVALTDGSPEARDTLAVAHAARGDFPSARRVAAQAIAAAEAQGRAALAEAIATRLAAFEREEAWRESPPSPR